MEPFHVKWGQFLPDWRDTKALFTPFSYPLWNTTLGRPWFFFLTPWLLWPLSHYPRLGPFSMGFRLHVSRIPGGFTAYPNSRAGVTIPRGMPIRQGRSGVKQSKCERAGCFPREQRSVKRAIHLHVPAGFSELFIYKDV